LRGWLAVFRLAFAAETGYKANYCRLEASRRSAPLGQDSSKRDFRYGRVCTENTRLKKAKTAKPKLFNEMMFRGHKTVKKHHIDII